MQKVIYFYKTVRYPESESVKVLVTQLCLTLCDPMDCSPPGSSDYGILQARILEWVAIPFSRGSSSTGDLPNPGIELGPLHCRRILYHEPPGKLHASMLLLLSRFSRVRLCATP